MQKSRKTHRRNRSQKREFLRAIQRVSGKFRKANGLNVTSTRCAHLPICRVQGGCVKALTTMTIDPASATLSYPIGVAAYRYESVAFTTNSYGAFSCHN
jgi:hypothetical protein